LCLISTCNLGRHGKGNNLGAFIQVQTGSSLSYTSGLQWVDLVGLKYQQWTI